MSSQVSANGIEISYTESGTDDAGTVLLVCGTGQPAAMWAMLGTTGGLVDAGYRVVEFDNRGMTGAACPTPPWTVADMAADAFAVLEAVGPAHVAGVSLGGLITQTLALQHPELVRTATFMFGGGQFGPAFAPMMTGLVELFELNGSIPKAIEQYMMVQACLTPDQRSDPAQVEAALLMSDLLTGGFGPGGQHGQYSASAAWIAEDHVSEVARLSMPVLVIANELDPIFPPTGLRALAEAVSDGTYVEVPGASHIGIDPASLELGRNALIKFLADH
jgi:pimeloyl-ACP methyl ester carboxylesterase